MNIPSLSKITLRMSTAPYLLALLFSLGASAQAEPASAASIPGIDAFEQVAARTGWMLFGGKLYWTKNDGASWTDIMPAANIQHGKTIQVNVEIEYRVSEFL